MRSLIPFTEKNVNAQHVNNVKGKIEPMKPAVSQERKS